jgi:hypothetical protein
VNDPDDDRDDEQPRGKVPMQHALDYHANEPDGGERCPWCDHDPSKQQVLAHDPDRGAIWIDIQTL